MAICKLRDDKATEIYSIPVDWLKAGEEPMAHILQPSSSPLPTPLTCWRVWSSLPGRGMGIDEPAIVTGVLHRSPSKASIPFRSYDVSEIAYGRSNLCPLRSPKYTVSWHLGHRWEFGFGLVAAYIDLKRALHRESHWEIRRLMRILASIIWSIVNQYTGTQSAVNCSSRELSRFFF